MILKPTPSPRLERSVKIESGEDIVQNKQVQSTKYSRNINLSKDTAMAMFNYGVGGNEVKVDANEAIQEIQENKTLLVGKLTADDAISPEIVTGLKTVEDVFRHFQPSISIEHEDQEGGSVKEDFRFNNVGDFTPNKLVENSPFLKNLNLEEEQYNNIMRQLRNNKVLRNMLADNSSKEALIQALKAVALELENNKK
ncbi:type VI secretion system contractile sheath small subunit [Capnocytophaga canis]|uniref:type VI secretion system contractile sheath small subunit n=1 Tax=Capnocytophaga canis TaxID=1848903 RepID=UPI001F508650|nr:type VI secretion system contractile sheath small subunit [Capnocytophaga canis]